MKYKQLAYIAIVAAIALPFAQKALGQDAIPIGIWRLHLSYNAIQRIAIGDTKIFAAAESGILVYNRVDHELTSINTLNGLTQTGITALAFDKARKQLLVAYENGNVDIVTDKTTFNFDRIGRSTIVSGSKRINHIVIRGALAYLAADFGVVVFDLTKLELRETWRDLGDDGTPLAITMTVIDGDSIHAATPEGVISGHLNDNLLDFSKWVRPNAGLPDAPVTSIEFFGGTLVVSPNGDGLYQKDGGQWMKLDIPELDGKTITSIARAGDDLLITEGDNVWELNATGTIDAVDAIPLATPAVALRDELGSLWIADSKNGLISNASGTFQSLIPNGPGSNTFIRLKHTGNRIYGIRGGFDAGQRLQRDGMLDYYENGNWHTDALSVRDITDLALAAGNVLYASSFGDGIEKVSGEGNPAVLNNSNSPLVAGAGGVQVTAIESAGDNLWVFDYSGATLRRYEPATNTWQNNWSTWPYIVDIRVDLFGDLWMIGDPQFGGGLDFLHPDDGSSQLLTTTPGQGGLPDNTVNAVEVDRLSQVWVGTNAGVAYFFSGHADAIRPIFENRFLLQNEKITAIKTDGGNRKWIGTDHGVWLFNATGEQLIHNFTTDNSPLLSNEIVAIEIDPVSGEVFFATNKGIISFRSDATEGAEAFNKLKIFPNPVTRDFAGTVGISGLIRDSEVKITDVSGKLIWQTRANGGTATWDVRDYNGNRAAKGIYLVFAATDGGKETVVGKIAVVD